MELEKLQNGSDIRGVALDGIPGEKVNLTSEAVYKLAGGFAQWVKKRVGRNDIVISVGRDSRLSGPTLADAIIKGLYSVEGVDVIYFDLCSTPAMFMSCIHKDVDADGAIMITASHLPFNRNGMKFFIKDGGAEKADIAEIIQLAEAVNVNLDEDATSLKLDFLSIYAGNLVGTIREKTGTEQPLKGYKIIVDAGNGVGGFFVDKVLKPLGADTDGSVFIDPDGNFPNHIPNPELKDVMDSFCETTIREKAALGIIFDTDVDRAAIVDGTGAEINRNRLVAVMSEICLEEAPGSYIVTDSVTSKGLKEFIESKGGVHHRFKRGYKNVINEGIRLNKEGKECLLAIETSGHCALKENYFLDDGAYMIVKILVKFVQLAKENQSFASLISTLAEPKEATEFRPVFQVEEFQPYGQQMLEEFKAYVGEMEGWSLETPNHEGVRVICDKDHGDGWILVRLSLHDPQMPVNIESDSQGGVAIMKGHVTDFLKNYQVKL